MKRINSIVAIATTTARNLGHRGPVDTNALHEREYDLQDNLVEIASGMGIAEADVRSALSRAGFSARPVVTPPTPEPVAALRDDVRGLLSNASALLAQAARQL